MINLKMKTTFLLLIFFPIFFLTSFLNAEIILTEVMANPANESQDEFLEIYNTADISVDLKGWKIKDASDSVDEILAWMNGGGQAMANTALVYDSLSLPAKSYAVILDSGYQDAVYFFPEGTVILTVGSTIGNGLKNDEDQVYLINSSDTVVSSFSYTSSEDSKSWERVAYDLSYWDECSASFGNTAGAENSISTFPIIKHLNDGSSLDIDTQILTTTFEANWSFVGAASYYFSLSEEMTLEQSDLVETTTATAITLNNLTLLPEITYYFHIQAENIYGRSLIERSDGVFILAEETENPIAKILITEVAPAIAGSNDWIELCVAAGTFSLDGYKLYEGTKLIKTFADIIVTAGDYIVLLVNSDESDEETKNSDGYWQFYATEAGFTATDNAFYLKDPRDEIVATLFYCNGDDNFTASNFDFLTEDDCFIWSDNDKYSISRKCPEDRYLDANPKTDLEMGEFSKGFQNEEKYISNIQLLITEVMPYDDNDEDWLEFYVLAGSGSLEGFKLKVGASVVKVFEDITVNTGDYFVLNFDKDLPASFPDFYTTISGITATDNSLIVLSPDGRYLDAVFYATVDNTWSMTNKSNFDLMISTGQWVAESSNESACFVWTKTSSRSIARKVAQTGIPIDTNRKDDFELSKLTKGFAKDVIIDSFSESFGVEFLNRHFSPYGDYKHNALQVKYKNDAETILCIKIYDIQAHFIKTLILIEEEEIGIVEWDGTDQQGNIMPVGVYLIYSEFIDAQTGKVSQEKKAVVLGRML
ncbi:MAG: lamin tail domain-containing protein [bacterium]|nr:lamin tail domain-containing protein [bacterium]